MCALLRFRLFEYLVLLYFVAACIDAAYLDAGGTHNVHSFVFI